MSRGKVKNFALSILLVVGFVFALGANAPTVYAEQSQQRLISVTGQAEIYVKPDVANASFGVETNASTAQEAQKLNSLAMNKVIADLQGKGIAKEDIQTSNFSLYPVYETQSQADRLYGKQVLTGYRCNNTVNVRIRDISSVGNIIDVAINAGATNVNNISFGVLDSSKFEDEILAKAVKNARHKAEIMARAAGVNITGVFRISDGYVSVSSTREMAKMDYAQDSVTPIEPGEVRIMSTVRMDFTF